MALGSWRTYERISRDQGVAVMRAAREAGINFLDDARYNDEPGHAPLPTGYSEVIFGELFRTAADAAAAGREVAALARDTGRDPAQLAMAFAALNPSVTTVLFGATRPEQVRANLGALAVADQLTQAERDRVSAIGARRGR
jgi:aryl-alcohol dehydrogenase-like predicted oxidoreductase